VYSKTPLEYSHLLLIRASINALHFGESTVRFFRRQLRVASALPKLKKQFLIASDRQAAVSCGLSFAAAWAELA
jgi:hypothetical protein